MASYYNVFLDVFANQIIALSLVCRFKCSSHKSFSWGNFRVIVSLIGEGGLGLV
jgi:hypothetical protein